MRTDTVSRRYARALFALADEQQALEGIGASLGTVVRLLGDPTLARVLAGPVTRDRKRELVRSIVTGVNAPASLRDFLLLLVDQDRVSHLAGIAAVYGSLVDRKQGITRATVHSAARLGDDMLGEINRVFGSVTGKRVVATVRIEPDLIAGIIVEVEGRVYDGSLRTQLGRLHQQMATGG